MEANEKESKDLQKDIEEYAMKVKELLRGDSEQDVKHSDESFGKPQTEINNANKSSAVTINNFDTEITTALNISSPIRVFKILNHSFGLMTLRTLNTKEKYTFYTRWKS